MAEAQIASIRMRPDIPDELASLVLRCLNKKPSEKDLAELRRQLATNPQLWRDVADLSHLARVVILDKLNLNQPAVQEGVLANIDGIRFEMSYKAAPLLEQMLIDNIINTWLFLQWAEIHHATHVMGGGITSQVGEYWTKILGAAQSRHIRACESLARVRKMALPAMQVNINAPDGQQVNIAGDFIKP